MKILHITAGKYVNINATFGAGHVTIKHNEYLIAWLKRLCDNRYTVGIGIWLVYEDGSEHKRDNFSFNEFEFTEIEEI